MDFVLAEKFRNDLLTVTVVKGKSNSYLLNFNHFSLPDGCCARSKRSRPKGFRCGPTVSKFYASGPVTL